VQSSSMQTRQFSTYLSLASLSTISKPSTLPASFSRAFWSL
jgi:hypothetical protein